MRTSLVLTLIGDDKPGIVEQVADRVLAAGANWEESRMARLAGKFAGVLRLSVDADRADALASSLATLRASGLSVIVEQGGRVEADAPPTFRLELLGNDRAGIVRDIARVLAERGVNIQELESAVTSAPMSGEALFRARAYLQLPPSLTADELRQTLEALAADLMVDLVLQEESERPERPTVPHPPATSR